MIAAPARQITAADLIGARVERLARYGAPASALWSPPKPIRSAASSWRSSLKMGGVIAMSVSTGCLTTVAATVS